MSAPIQLWNNIRAELRRSVPEDLFETWLAPLEATQFDGQRLVISAPAEIAGWVRDRFGNTLRQAVDRAVGNERAIAISLVADGCDPAPASAQGADGPRAPRERALHPKYTFEQFVIGNTNRFAHAASLSAAELPGSAYNPLLLIGPPGVGKTHLLHSIGNYVTEYGSGLTVRYTTAEDFTNDFRAALDRRSTGTFKDHYRHADVLLIDDVQFLANKTRTGEEFFHTFNAVRESGSQLVLTADRPPAEMSGLQERLCQRFESGLTVEVGKPDRAMRVAILRKRAEVDGLALADEVIDAVADRVTDTIRALEAALIRIAAYASLTGEQIDADLTGRVLDQLYKRDVTRRGPEISVAQIQSMVAAEFGITTEEMLSPSRAARITWPRQVAMYLARENTRSSLPQIGGSFGGRDHTTVLHACRRATERLANDTDAADTIASLQARISAGPDSDRDS